MIIYSTTRTSGYLFPAASGRARYPIGHLNRTNTQMCGNMANCSPAGVVQMLKDPVTAERSLAEFLSWNNASHSAVCSYTPEQVLKMLVGSLSSEAHRPGSAQLLLSLAGRYSRQIANYLVGASSDLACGPEASRILYMLSLDHCEEVLWPAAMSLQTPRYRSVAERLITDIAGHEPDKVVLYFLNDLGDPARKAVALVMLKKIGAISLFHKTVVSNKAMKYINKPGMIDDIRDLLVDIGKGYGDSNLFGEAMHHDYIHVIQPIGMALLSQKKREAAKYLLTELGRGHCPAAVTSFMWHLIEKDGNRPAVVEAARDVIEKVNVR